MKTMRCSWGWLAGIVLSACATAAFAQAALPVIFVNGPQGERAMLTFSAENGWRSHAGRSPQDRSKPVEAPEKPLTVFVDGPTGNTFVYTQQEGWKYVGRIADPRH
jgi:hypothetical protein